MKLGDLKAAALRIICENTHKAPCFCAGDWSSADDATALATFVRDALSSPATAVRVEYRCNRNEGVSGRVVDLAAHFPNDEDAMRWARELGTGARSCDTLTRIVHTLAVEVEACESRPEQGSGKVAP